MNSEQKRTRLKNIGNKSLISEFTHPDILTPEPQRNKAISLFSNSKMDSLQIFQEELNAVMKSTKKKREPRIVKAYTEELKPQSETENLMKEINTLKTQISSNKKIEKVEEKLDNLIISLEEQKLRQQEQILKTTPNIVKETNTQPIMIPYPQFYPQPIYPSYYPTSSSIYRSRKKIYSESDEESYKSKRSNMFRKSLVKQKVNRLKVIFIAVTYTIFVRNEAKKLASARKSALRYFWDNKQESEMVNLKNWLLESQKFSFSIILEKKSLSFSYMDEKSSRIKQEKEKLIMQVVGIGINKMQEDCSPEKISLFSELLEKTCKKGSFAINGLWTAYELNQICISEFLGFFRIDHSLEKSLIGIFVLMKVFIYNMLLQPYKFDSNNFPKKEQPLNNNMKIIASIYYYLVKEIIEEYQNEIRDSDIYQIGNWENIPKEHTIECSQPLIYGNVKPDPDEHISGLIDEFEVSNLKNTEPWNVCNKKLKLIIEKLHSESIYKRKKAKLNSKQYFYK